MDGENRCICRTTHKFAGNISHREQQALHQTEISFMLGNDYYAHCPLSLPPFTRLDSCPPARLPACPPARLPACRTLQLYAVYPVARPAVARPAVARPGRRPFGSRIVAVLHAPSSVGLNRNLCVGPSLKICNA